MNEAFESWVCWAPISVSKTSELWWFECQKQINKLTSIFFCVCARNPGEWFCSKLLRHKRPYFSACSSFVLRFTNWFIHLRLRYTTSKHHERRKQFSITQYHYFAGKGMLKSTHEQAVYQACANLLIFRSMKRLRVFLLRLDEMLWLPSALTLPVPIYTPGWREAL